MLQEVGGILRYVSGRPRRALQRFVTKTPGVRNT
jgi:hypothetical protein